MRKVVVTGFLTLDGVMEAPGGEFHPGREGRWTFQFFNDEAGKFKFDELFAADGSSPRGPTRTRVFPERRLREPGGTDAMVEE